MDKSIRFNLDKQVDLSFYDQIKGQLLSAIYCGKIKEGERLPSIRELAEDLEVNYKTIRKIYVRLSEENYIEIVKGSGAFLHKRKGGNDYEEMRKSAIFKLLKEVSGRAKNLGLQPERFLRLFESYVARTNLRKLSLAIVDHPEEALIFARELAMRLGVDASPVPLEQEPGPSEAQALERSDYLLTTSWHMEEVSELAQGLGKTVMEIKPSHEIYTEIMNEIQTRNIAIVVQDERTLHASWEVFMNIFHPATDNKFWIAPIDREDLVSKILDEADLIFVSPLCWDEMRRRAPASKQLKTYENVISQETIDALRQLQLLG